MVVGRKLLQKAESAFLKYPKAYLSALFERRDAVRLSRTLRSRVRRNKGALPSASKSGTIVFNTVRTYGVQPWIEYVLAYLLAEMGHETHVLYDDGVMEHWDNIQAHSLSSPHDGSEVLTSERRIRTSNPLARGVRKLELRNRDRIFRHDNLTSHTYSGIVGNKNLENVCLPEGHDRHSMSSTIRFFGGKDFDRQSRAVQSFWERTDVNNRVSSAVGHFVVEKLDPDLFVTSHGIYSTWGCCYDVVSEADVSTVVYKIQTSRPNRLQLFDVIAQNVSSSPKWQEQKSKPLTEGELSSVDNFINKRIKKESPDNEVYFSQKEEKKIEKKILEHIKEKEEATLGMFPNVPWDGNVREQNTIFDDVTDWICKTVEWIRKSSVDMVIRFHPAESTKLEGGRKMEDIVKKRLVELEGDGVLVVKSNESLDTYDLVRRVDVGLVYDGTLASEIPLLRTPVIAGGRGRFAQEGWAYMPDSREEYKEWISSPSSILESFEESREERIEKLKRFIHWNHFKSSYNFPALSGLKKTEKGLFSRNSDIRIVSNIVKKEDLNQYKKILNSLINNI